MCPNDLDFRANILQLTSTLQDFACESETSPTKEKVERAALRNYVFRMKNKAASGTKIGINKHKDDLGSGKSYSIR